MEIEAYLPPPAVRVEKLCNSYALRTLKFHKNHLVKRVLWEELERDDSDITLDSDSEAGNTSIKYITRPNTRLLSLLKRTQEFITNWKIEKISRILFTSNWNLGDSVKIMDAELFAILKALEREKTQCEKGQSTTKNLWVFVDNQAALKRLQKNSLEEGRELTGFLAIRTSWGMI
ncbi:hypothetical protein M501DRAFT_996572 [Patellaria atrata CBS 101060]|uniref:Uncharacterized protein n=1 Tax=Patellaria atrata CBS 101060 TaxID=1346257 RepID=A0A9P4VNL8_9PEZI|nr:hypothetical protein M501DRAFT_996572 [Patellaria atrata CBS 101060]